MADIQTICQVVMKYGRDSRRFVTPSTPIDPIQPAPSNLSDDDFNGFYFELLGALADANISASVPIKGLRACQIWQHVCILILHHQ